jgi:hypothetical protein
MPQDSTGDAYAWDLASVVEARDPTPDYDESGNVAMASSSSLTARLVPHHKWFNMESSGVPLFTLDNMGEHI